jgi:hypothetical protein
VRACYWLAHQRTVTTAGLGLIVATAPGEVRFGQDRIPDGSGVDMHHVRRRAETDTSPTARRVLLHLDSQVAHAGFAK